MNFRSVLTALAVPALFAGLASAENPGLPTNQNLTCTVSADTNPSIRTEGKAELVGDVLLKCTGGPTQNGTVADLGHVNVVVDYGVPVTSRATGAKVDGKQPVDALLFIDEPLTDASSFKAFKVCAFGAACVQDLTLAAPPNNALVATDENAYQGFIPKDKPNQLEFDNVPVVVLGGTNQQHIFRVSNARVAPGSSPVVGSVTVAPVTNTYISLLLNGGSSATVATPAQGLLTSVAAPGISLCTSADLAGANGSPNLSLLTFKEGFNGAFKLQKIVADQSKVGGSYTINNATVTTQQSESGVVVDAYGVASSATRLKAVFSGLDKNVTYYVSVNNVADYKTAAPTVRAAALKQGAGIETLDDVAGSFVDALAAPTAWGAVPVVKLEVKNGGAEAVWQITNPSFSAADSITFSVYAVYNTVTAAPTATSSTTVQLGFAPSITDKADDKNNTWIPRFAAPPAAVPFAPVLPCQTTLLFPFVTNLSGYETGIAISNTSADTFGTSNSNGKCALNFFGTYSGTGTAPTNPVWMTDPSDLATAVDLQAGKTVANTASLLLGTNVGFQGYMMAVCNFQYAHGFAYILNSTNAAMGYLASVVADTNRGTALLGEQLGN